MLRRATVKIKISNITIYDGIKNKNENNSIVFDETGILAIGQAADEIKEDLFIDGSGLCCLPGLVNSHVHLSCNGEPDMAAQIKQQSEADLAYTALRNAQKQLESGVVAVRDLGGKFNVAISARNAINRNIVNGPRIYASGEVICMTGGHCNVMGIESDGPDENRKSARKLIKAGADVIKVMATGGGLSAGMSVGATQLTEEEIRAICDEAKKAGKTTAAHAQGKQGIMNAIRGGITTIEHGIALDNEVFEAMLENNVYLCATVMSPYYVAKYGIEAGIPAFAVEKAKYWAGPQSEGLQKAIKAGIKIIAGNDAGTPFNYHDDFASELQKMVELGMTVRDVIKSATYYPAELLSVLDRTGSIEVGKWADLTILEGDPEIDIESFKNVEYVFKGGVCAYRKNKS
jgi:imidazolonepropionase-like amidohydrolase